MVKTLRRRLADGRTRKLIATIFAGKMIGVIAVLFAVNQIVGLIDTPASAQTVTHQANDLVNPVNTIWVLVTAFLVFFMQAGFMALEAGFARSRETVNVLTECVVDTFLCGLLFWAFGFAFMFGEGNGLIGHQFFLLHGAPATYGSTGVAFLAFWLFQFAFADTCSTITSGAMVGRTGFKGDLLYSIGVSGFIYPIFGHWVWGPGGWLGNMTPGFLNTFTGGAVFRDFAGSTVVHTVGGFIALAGRDRPGPAARPQVQAGRGWPAAAARPDDRGDRRCDPVVRLVRVQPRVDALRARLRRDRSRRRQHHPRGVRGRAGRDVLGLPTLEEVGPGHVHQRVPRRAGGDHVPVLLGLTGGRRPHRRDRRYRRSPWRRLHRVDQGGRPGRRGRGPRLRRDLGDPEPGPVRHGGVRHPDPRRRRHVHHREGLVLRRRDRPAQGPVHREPHVRGGSSGPWPSR